MRRRPFTAKTEARIDEATKDALIRLAAERGVTEAVLVRQAIDHLLAQRRRTP